MGKPTSETKDELAQGIDVKPTLKVSGITVTGDSLTGDNEFNKRLIAKLMQFDAKSKEGAWSNGLPWDAYLIKMIVSEQVKKLAVRLQNELNKSKKDSAKHELIGNCLAALRPNKTSEEKKHQTDDAIKSTYLDLSDPRLITFLGQPICLRFAEGGASALNYHGRLQRIKKLDIKSITTDVKNNATRYILTNLDTLNKRKRVFVQSNIVQPDKKNIRSFNNNRLFIQWIGANDFMTENRYPTDKIVSEVIAKRIADIEQQIKRGYKHFILVNMPNMGLTPAFVDSKESVVGDDGRKRSMAEHMTYYCDKFNTELLKKVKALKTEGCSFEVFDSFDAMTKIHGGVIEEKDVIDIDGTKLDIRCFDQKKLASMYLASEEYRKTGKVAPNHGYMFWDDVHPTNLLHDMLAKLLLNKIKKNFTVEAQPAILDILNKPESASIACDVAQLLAQQQLISAYNKELSRSKTGFGGCMRVSNFKRLNFSFQQLFKETVFNHNMIFNTGNRRLKVLLEIGMIKKIKSNGCFAKATYALNTDYEFYNKKLQDAFDRLNHINTVTYARNGSLHHGDEKVAMGIGSAAASNPVVSPVVSKLGLYRKL